MHVTATRARDDADLHPLTHPLTASIPHVCLNAYTSPASNLMHKFKSNI